MNEYYAERDKGPRVNGKIHLPINGGTACGLGPKQFKALDESHFHSKHPKDLTCNSCKNIEANHDPECGWVNDWHDCSCRLDTIDIKFPATLEWEVHDELPAGSLCEGHDSYYNLDALEHHIEWNKEFFEERGHRGIYIKIRIGSNWFRA
jgi:hypothetical protein